VALGLLQNHLGNIEKRVRAPSHFNLSRERFHAFVVRHQTHADFWQRRGRLAALARFISARKRSVATWRPAATAFGPWPASAFAAWAISFTSLPGSTFAPRGTRSPPLLAAVGSPCLALVLGVLLRGRRFLRPGRQEKLFQIKFVIRQCAH
jgi:hypothetical protein